MSKKQNPTGGNGGGKAKMSAVGDSISKRDYTSVRVGRVVVGYVSGDTFYKTVRASAHFLRVPPAICFDLSTLDDAQNAGAYYCEVTDAESGRVYRAALSTIRVKGFRVNRGFGEQWGLSLIEWTRAGEGEQLSLFAGMMP